MLTQQENFNPQPGFIGLFDLVAHVRDVSVDSELQDRQAEAVSAGKVPIVGENVQIELAPDSFIGNVASIGSNVRIGESVCLHEGVTICNEAVLGDSATVGAHSRIGEQAYIGDRVFIDDDSTLGDSIVVGDRSTVGMGVKLGDGCEFGSNVKIGSDSSFGQDVQVGNNANIRTKVVFADNVKIGDDSEIGYRTTIGKDTDIDEGAKIKHDITIGEKSSFGICVYIGSNAQIEGAVDIRDRVTIGASSEIRSYSELQDEVETSEWVRIPCDANVPAGSHVNSSHSITTISNLGERSRIITLVGSKKGPLLSGGCQDGVPISEYSGDEAGSVTNTTSESHYTEVWPAIDSLGKAVQRAYESAPKRRRRYPKSA